MNGAILTLRDLYTAYAMDAIPTESVWQSCGGNLVRLDTFEWFRLGSLGPISDTGALGHGGFLRPSDPMGLAAIAAIVANLSDLPPLGAVLTVDAWAHGGVYVTLDAGREDIAFLPHTVPALASLAEDVEKDLARAVVAVVLHLLALRV
jgi:hypothetical protein